MRQAAEKTREPQLQVTQLWGERVVDLGQFRAGTDVLIGSGKRADFTVHAGSIGEAFSLARLQGNRVEVHVPKGACVRVFQPGAEIRSGATLRSAGRLVAEGEGESLTLGLNEHAVIHLETGTFVIRPVRAPEREAIPLLREDDYTYFKVASYALMGFVALLIAVGVTPDLEEAPEEGFRAPQRMARALVPPIRLEPPKPAPAEGARAAKPEGRVGKEESTVKEAPRSRHKATTDRKVVEGAGLLGALRASGDTSNVFKERGLGAGINDAIGGLKGNGPEVADANGVGGLGSRGTGPGGGGDELSIGGGLGTRGKGPGGPGNGVGFDPGRKETVRIEVGKDILVDGLDREVIAKVVRSKQREIKHCYDNELAKDPSLAGKVAVSWTIDSAGVVADASVSEGLGNASLESCMLSKIRRWTFPQPKGGGIVAVNFPWIFNSAEAP